ncbi:MAG: hypothetical protein JJU03_00900 [Idiomarina sp.]|nr:hypothetical protein [Idiomarina sp.]
MSCMRTLKLACFVVVSGLALSACSKGPSVTEVQNALDESIFASSRVAAAFTRQAMDKQVRVDRVDNCQAIQTGSGYICDVEYSVLSNSGARPTQSMVESLELREGRDGWEIID